MVLFLMKIALLHVLQDISRFFELLHIKLSNMKRNLIALGKPLLWSGLAILALVVYFSQIAARIEYNQAIVGLVFFLMTILDIQISDISFRTISRKLDGRKITRKMILIVSILVPIAVISFITGWNTLPANMMAEPWHEIHHSPVRDHGQLLSAILHSMTNLITFRY